MPAVDAAPTSRRPDVTETRANSGEPPPARERSFLVGATILFGLAALTAAVGGVAPEFDYGQFVHALRRLPLSHLALALSATAISFAGFVGREASAMRYVGARAPRLAVVLCGLTAPALNNLAGFGLFTSGAVRYRIYGGVGVPPLAIARIVGLVMAGFAVGLGAVGGGAALARGPDLAALFGWRTLWVDLAGGAALAAVAMLLAFGLPAPLRRTRAPSGAADRAFLSVQALCTALRLLGAATALWVLLPRGLVGFGSFVPLFAAATALAALSHVPAGAGVFELIVLWALRGRAPAGDVAAALVAFRAVYYGLPFLLSGVVFAVFEWRLAFDPSMPKADAKLARAATRLTPTFVGLLAFGVGVVLIFSGATPTFGWRLTSLSRHVPLWVLEAASFFGSAVGVAFLFLTRGLLDRRNGAWRLAVAATLASLVFSLPKGLAFGEAALLAGFLALLMATRRRFERPTSLFDQPFTRGWIVAVGIIFVAAFGVFWLAFHNGAHPLGNLWSFEFDAQASRALRALLGAALSAGGFALWHLLRAPSGRPAPPDPAALASALDVVAIAPRPEAQMALMGDKALMVSASGRAFLMYGKRGRSWIALHDPFGPREEWRELVERFVKLAAEHGGRANFYQTGPDSLSFYLDFGFSAMKIGEEAILDLSGFTLKGGACSHLRYALKRGERDGLSFAWLAPEAAMDRLHDFALVSEAWLESAGTEEKGFSVAAFEPSYLARQSFGLVLEHGRPVAFASVMTSGEAATLGLLRHACVESPVATEFLITQTALALRESGYARFSLGAAPLAGVGPSPLRTRWGRVAGLLWRHGARFYNFQGLRAFKNKFNPRWEPRYLVSSGAIGPFLALADTAALIGSSAPKPRASVNA